MPEISVINDGTVVVVEDGYNIIQRANDPELLASVVELTTKKSQLSSLGFNITNMTKEDFNDGIGFYADKNIASDTIKRLSFIVKTKKK